jgi:hypothetical protein
VEYYTPRTILLVDVARYSDDRGNARTLRRGIDDVSRARFNLAHELAHLLGWGSSNHSGMTATVEAAHWLAGATPIDDWPDGSPIDAAPSGTSSTPPFDGTRFNLWSRRVGAPVKILGETFALSRMPYGLPSPRIRPRFREEALSPDSRAALLRLLDGILAALCLMLVLVLAALSRHPDGLIYLLVMLAVCLRYGHRGEPDAYTSLPPRRYERSLGSCPQQ